MSKGKQSGSALVIGIIIAVIIIGGAAAVYFVTKDSGDNDNDAETTTSNTTVQNKDNASPAAPKSLPDGYPAKAAPVYQPSTITQAGKIGSAWLVTVETKDGVNDVAKSIYDNYKSLGAKVTLTPLNDEGVGQVAGGNGGYGVIITYSTDGDSGATSISYHVEPQIKR